MSAPKLTAKQRKVLSVCAEYCGSALTDNATANALARRGYVTTIRAAGMRGRCVVVITRAGQAALKGGGS